VIIILVESEQRTLFLVYLYLQARNSLQYERALLFSFVKISPDIIKSTSYVCITDFGDFKKSTWFLQVRSILLFLLNNLVAFGLVSFPLTSGR